MKGRLVLGRHTNDRGGCPLLPLFHKFPWSKLGEFGRTTSKDTAKLCSLLRSISPGDPRIRAAQGHWALEGGVWNVG